MANTNGHKMADGLSVDVTVPSGTIVAQGEFVYLDGFFGLAEFDDKPVSTGAAVISINIEQAHYDTDQITTAEAYAVGAVVNFNTTSKLFTVAAASGTILPVGRITIAKNADNVIGFLMFAQRLA